MKNPIIAPSLLSSDFGRLEETIHILNDSNADWIHCDIMDGIFVPNITFGFPILKIISSHSKLPLDVHLMIHQPERYIRDFAKVGSNILTVHIEACIHLDRTLNEIKENGMKAGIALNPATPVESLMHVLHLLDVICLMSVNPGFGGQKFIPQVYQKIKTLSNWKKDSDYTYLIEVDGGVGLGNAKKLIDAGTDILVAGNSIFSAGEISQNIDQLKFLN